MENKEAKICPLMSISETDFLRCRESECAWWDEDRQKCAMAVTPPRK